MNQIWEGQPGAVEGVLGTFDQLVTGKCITEEVKQTSSQPGSSLLRLQKRIRQSAPWLDDKGVRMDRNTEGYDQAYQGVNEEMEYQIGDMEGWWKDGKSMDTDIVWVPTRE